MERRAFVARAAAMAAVPSLARAQGSLPVVAFLRSTTSEGFEHVEAAFRAGLAARGVEDGRDAVVVARFGDNRPERLAMLVDELVARRVAVVVGNSVAAEAMKRRTSTIPIVFVTADDPARRGLVASLARPGGNATGVTFFGGGLLGAKRFELLHELAPEAQPVGFLMNTGWAAAEDEAADARAAAQARGLRLVVAKASGLRDLDAAFDRLARDGIRALIVGGSPTFSGARRDIVARVAARAWPAIYDQRDYVDAGGLMSYGGTLAGAYRQAADYAAAILRGAKPGDLPVQQPTSFGLVLNAKTARALRLEIPASLRLRADTVID